MKYLLALISIVLGSVAQYFLKVGMNSVGVDNLSLMEVIKKALSSVSLWGGIACYGASMLFWLYVLSQMELSKAYPLVSLGYVFTLFIGYFCLGESLSAGKIIGVLLIVSGVIFLSRA